MLSATILGHCPLSGLQGIFLHRIYNIILFTNILIFHCEPLSITCQFHGLLTIQLYKDQYDQLSLVGINFPYTPCRSGNLNKFKTHAVFEYDTLLTCNGSLM